MNHVDEVLHYDKKEDKYVGMGLSISHDNEANTEYVRVNRRRVGEDGRPVGTEYNNPLMYKIQYEFQYACGDTYYLTAHVVAENLLSQVDE